MKYFTKTQAIKYMKNKGLHFKMDKKLFKQLEDTGRIFPDRPGILKMYSQKLLDKYCDEVRPR